MQTFTGKNLKSLLFLSLVLLGISYAGAANAQVSNTSENESSVQSLSPPDVILNGKKIIFSKQPVLDEEGWLFPLEEIAEKLQSKVTVDIINGTITIQRLEDKTLVQLNTRTGILTINNSPFKKLFGYQRIILGKDSQMVPTSALVMLLKLAVQDTNDNNLVLNSTIGKETTFTGTVQPMTRTGISDLLVDYLTVTNSFDWLQSQSLFSRRTEINSGFHNDSYAITGDLSVKSGTEAPLVNFESGNFSYYKNNTPLQIHVGDKQLSSIKSPLIGGIIMRGIQLQKQGPVIKDSRLVTGIGLLPTNGKILGRNLSFVKYGRLSQFVEWSSSPEKMWQFSIAEALYNDLIPNQLVKTKQTGGLFALNITKTGKYLEGETNLGAGFVKNKENINSGSGPGGDALIRFKPKEWLNFFSKGAYYSPNFYPLAGNTFYNSRNEATFGVNISPPRSNIGVSRSTGKFNLQAKRPNKYDVTNVSFSTTPLKNGPTIITSYSKNESQISSTRAIDNLFSPVNMLSNANLDDLIERRTNSFFRASILKNWTGANLTTNINHFTFSEKSPLRIPAFNEKAITEFWSYDINLNKSLNRFIWLQSYFQGSKLYKQIRFGLNLGPMLNDKLNLLLESGALLTNGQDISKIYGLNLNYQVNKKSQLSLQFDKSVFLTSLSALWQYNLRGKYNKAFIEYAEEQSIGRIKGNVLVLEEGEKKQLPESKIVLPVITRERGLTNVRIHLGNYIIATDQKGQFEFQSLTPGVYKVKIEYSDLPSYLTSITPETVDIKVEPGKETNFNFILAYFGSLSGKLRLADESAMKPDEEITLQDIRIYLEGTEFETLTNIDGSFVLGDVKPGKYKLKVDPDFLPNGLEADQKGIEIEVHAKQKIENVELSVKFKSRPEEIQVF